MHLSPTSKLGYLSFKGGFQLTRFWVARLGNSYALIGKRQTVYMERLHLQTLVVQMLRGRIVQINDKSMKIGTQGNSGTLISNRSGPTLDFVNFSYNFK